MTAETTTTRSPTDPLPRLPDVELDVRVSYDGIRHEITFSDGRPPIFFEYDPVLGAPPEGPIANDFALIAALPLAMGYSFNIRTKFPVDAVLLDGLSHFQEVWGRWRPDIFRTQVQILAAEETLKSASLQRPPVAIAAFSSGVDSTFMLVRHIFDLAGRGRRRIRSAVMIHGFDMPLESVEGFKKLAANGRAMAQDLGVTFHVVRTNWKSLILDWEMTFGVGLAASLHFLSAGHQVGLIATEESYLNSFPIWGNSFWSDRFFSGSAFRIESDGGAFDRVERIRLLAPFPSFTRRLRVCYAGPRTGDNCGVCPKCILAKLGLLIAGAAQPWPFPQPLSLEQIQTMGIVNEWQVRFLKVILAKLKAQPSAPRDIVQAVQARLDRYAAEHK
jgi:hypothetical protein